MRCPQCNGKLRRVTRDENSMLNEYQFDAVKAGDYYCDKCPDNKRGKSGLCYWWERADKLSTVLLAASNRFTFSPTIEEIEAIFAEYPLEEK